MKINKYKPHESLKNSVMSQITDNGYSDVLLSLPETSRKKTRVIPLLSAAAAITLIICASVYVIGLDGYNRAKNESMMTDDEASTGSTDDVFDEYGDTIIGSDGSANPSEDEFDADSPPMSDDFVIQDFVSNDNGFIPKEESSSDTDKNGSSKGDSAPATVNINDSVFNLTDEDVNEIKRLLNMGKYLPLVCECVPRCTIKIGEKTYVLHNDCKNVVTGGGMLQGVDVEAIDKIISKNIVK